MWVKDIYGNLVNLDRVTMVRSTTKTNDEGEKHFVMAYFDQGYTTLLEGLKVEAEKYIMNLELKLKPAQILMGKLQ